MENGARPYYCVEIDSNIEGKKYVPLRSSTVDNVLSTVFFMHLLHLFTAIFFFQKKEKFILAPTDKAPMKICRGTGSIDLQSSINLLVTYGQGRCSEMSNLRAKMTFRFDDSDQTNDSHNRRGGEESKGQERLTDWQELSDGTIVTGTERTSHVSDEVIPVASRLPDKQEREDSQSEQTSEAEENERVERWVREADQQSGYHVPLNSYSFTASVEDPAGGSLGDQGELIWHGVHTRSRKPTVWRVIASVAGALATGALFGFLALSLFKGEVTMPNPANAIPVSAYDQQGQSGSSAREPTGVPSKVKAGDSGGKPATSPVGGSRSATAASLNVSDVNIPEKVFYMLQYGVFDQAEGAQKAVSDLRSLGMAAMEEKSEQHRVYAAIAPSKEDAMGLSTLLKNNQMELYVRTLSRPAITKLAFQGNAVSVERFLSQSDRVNEWLMSQSITHLEKENAEAFSPESTKQLKNEHQKWTQQMSAVQEGIPDQAKTVWTKLVQSMNTAISAVNEYNKQPSFSHLWSVQQAVMLYRVSERAWLETMMV